MMHTNNAIVGSHRGWLKNHILRLLGSVFITNERLKSKKPAE